MRDARPTIRFTADRGDARLRLDQVLVRRITSISRMSRNRAQDWIEQGAVRVNGIRAARASLRVSEGAQVEVAPPASAVAKERPAAEPGALDILYEDDDLLAVNKPAGIVVHPSYKHPRQTLLNAVLWHLRGARGTAAIVTRLDKGTSGVLLVAKSPDVHARLQRAMRAGGLCKIYLALVIGHPRPPSGTIALPLARDPDDRRRVVVDPHGRESVTRYRTLRADQATSLVECELLTGRTHQIRVHLSASGWPIAGDRVYGGTIAPELPHQALHAWRLSLTHPLTAAPLDVVAPPPAWGDDLHS